MKIRGSTSFRDRYGPWAVVAGSSAGLGAEFAIQLARKGINLVLIARRAQLLAELAESLSAQWKIAVRSFPLELGGIGAASEIIAATQDIEIGLFVYNAAYSKIGLFFNHSLADHLQELQVNCQTPLAMVYAFGQRMMARGQGGIILMSSLSASQGSAYISHYTATKAYNQILAEGLWEELRSQGVDVLACCAGATLTPNYLHSLEGHADRGPATAMSPQAVVLETLTALGKQPSLVPGRTNRLAALLMRRVLPRRSAIRLMGRVLRAMYGRENVPENPAPLHDL